MSDSIQMTAAAAITAPPQSKSSAGNVSNTDSEDDSTAFNAVFSGYVASDAEATEKKMAENMADLFNPSLPQELLVSGNTLPEEDTPQSWQALMLLQPADNAISNSTQFKATDLLEQRKPVLSSRDNGALLTQQFTQDLGLQLKDTENALLIGPAAQNLSSRLSEVQFIPDKNATLLVSVTEQTVPIHGGNSTLNQSLAAVGLGTAVQAATTQTHMAPLNLGQNAWETNFGSRLQMLVGQNTQSAEIRLDPPELGSLDIKIKVTNDIATVNITSPHSHVRDALESAVPRLREMFADSGVSLGDVNVRQESFAQGQNSANEDTGRYISDEGNGYDIEPVAVINKRVSEGLLDIYA
jgi:flagellar hook-length control protein FliK